MRIKTTGLYKTREGRVVTLVPHESTTGLLYCPENGFVYVMDSEEGSLVLFTETPDDIVELVKPDEEGAIDMKFNFGDKVRYTGNALSYLKGKEGKFDCYVLSASNPGACFVSFEGSKWADNLEAVLEEELELVSSESSNQSLVEEFHKKFNLPIGVPFEEVDDESPDMDLLVLRLDLIKEEYQEFLEAGMKFKGEERKQELLSEMADILYVLYGFAVVYGWDLDGAFKRIHEQNMSKLDGEGNPVYREDGKVLKGPNYKKATMEGLV